MMLRMRRQRGRGLVSRLRKRRGVLLKRQLQPPKGNLQLKRRNEMQLLQAVN